jgi:hypothetical protein
MTDMTQRLLEMVRRDPPSHQTRNQSLTLAVENSISHQIRSPLLKDLPNRKKYNNQKYYNWVRGKTQQEKL